MFVQLFFSDHVYTISKWMCVFVSDWWHVDHFSKCFCVWCTHDVSFQSECLLKSFMINAFAYLNCKKLKFTRYKLEVKSYTFELFIHFHWWVMKKRLTMPNRLPKILRMLTWGDEWAFSFTLFESSQHSIGSSLVVHPLAWW